MPDILSRKKTRVPLSQQELYYFKKIKELKELQKIELFKTTLFYKFINAINIILAAFLTYCVLSVLVLTHWKQTNVQVVNSTLGLINPETNKNSISELQIETTSFEKVVFSTTDLYKAPTVNEIIFLGKDFLFNKTFKLKLNYNTHFFWNINAYACLTVCGFCLLMGCFIYSINRHLYINGLLMVLCLFSLASLYFIMI